MRHQEKEQEQEYSMEQIRISVRCLVEFILQSGDIDNRHGSMPDKEAMQIGSRLHRKIQGQMGAAYRAEVALKQVIDCQEYSISVEGRADGIFTEDEQCFIDEIKGVAKEVGRIDEPVPVHLAQAKCYACIYAQQENLEQIGVQMTYVNLDTEEVRRIRKEYTQLELKEWFDELIEKYKKWASFQVSWKQTRQESIKPVVFPYSYRDGQKNLAGAVYRTIARKKKLFIQAPTGVGKTMATVFPSVKAVGEGIGDKIFYLTAKTITRTVAQEAFVLLKKQGLQYKVATLTAKEKLCICKEPDCNPVNCPYARGHYDRINDAVFELLTGICEHEPPNTEAADELMDETFTQRRMFADETAKEMQSAEQGQDNLSEEEYLRERENGNYTREVILTHARRWQVCPFEMSLDLSLWVDAIICDYNYVFDPQAKLKRFFADGVKGDYIFLIDEAHNLVERGREMYSAALYKEDFLEIKRLLKPYSKKAERTLEKCNKYLLEMKRECENYQLLNDIGPFAIALMNASSQLENLLEEQESVLNRAGSDPQMRKTVLEFYFQVRSFLEVYEELDDNYQIYTEQEADGRFKLKLYCIQPAGKIGDCLAKGRGTILFSATLLPVRYYMELLSGTEDDYAVYAKSTFDPAKKKLLIGSDVSSRYTRRGEEEYRRIARYLEEMVNAQPGNYLVFFPSYKMMEEVREIFEPECRLPVKILMQNARMTEGQREEFLEEFRFVEEKMSAGTVQESLLGFCVMGGIFGEGIDLKRDQLIGAAVVGTGLPQICNEREILKQYYDKRNEDGFAYAYQYPGMNKVMQSAGRVIRTDEDRGVILLLDERFCQWQYRNIFPREWADYEICSLQNVRAKLRRFWE